MVRKFTLGLLFVLLILNGFIAGVQAQPEGDVFLIVTPRGFESGLIWLVRLKEMQGFMVEMILADGKTADEIRMDILSRTPDYVLLMGDVDNGVLSVPAFVGLTGNVTDLYYGVMDNGYMPDIPVGRLPARSTEQLLRMTAALVNYEFQDRILLTYFKPEDYPAVEDLQYYVFDLADGNGDVLQLPDTPQEDVIEAINAGRSIITYSGHGGTDWWLGLRQDELGMICVENAVVLSFACHTGDYGVPEVFGETWLVTGKAVVFIGAASQSYWVQDDIFERGMAEVYFGGEDEVSAIMAGGKEAVLAHYGDSLPARQCFENYNLLGDPSLRINTTNAGLIEFDYGPAAYLPVVVR